MIWPLRKPALQPLPAALCGKLPCQPDFVREGLRSRASNELDDFLVRATEALHASVGVDQLTPTLFCQCLPGEPQGLVGICGPSHDAAQRAFPVALARAFPADRTHTPGRVFTSARAFLDGADALLARLPMLTLDALRVALGELPELEPLAPQPPPLSAAALQAALGADQQSRAYALYTLAAAFAQRPSGPIPQSAVVLDCPLAAPAAADSWLELAAQIAQRLGTTLCVLHQPERRLLLAIGGWHPVLLRALAQPERAFRELWPLSSPARDAREYARIALEDDAGPMFPSDRSQPLAIAELARRLARFSKTLRS